MECAWRRRNQTKLKQNLTLAGKVRPNGRNHEVLTTEWEPEGQAQRSKFKRIKISRPNEKIILLDLNRFVRFLREVHSPRTPLANKVLNKEKNSRNSRNSH